VYVRVFGVGKFKYGNKNLKGAKGVAIARQFRQNMPKMHEFQLCTQYGAIYVYDSVFGVVQFKYDVGIFQGAKGVDRATKFRQKISQNCTNFSSM